MLKKAVMSQRLTGAMVFQEGIFTDGREPLLKGVPHNLPGVFW